METAFRKFAEGLAEHAREGVCIEEKILEWKLADLKMRGDKREEVIPQAKAS